MHEQNKEDNSDEVYQESEFIRVNVIIQQENDEDSTLLHRDDDSNKFGGLNSC